MPGEQRVSGMGPQMRAPRVSAAILAALVAASCGGPGQASPSASAPGRTAATSAAASSAQVPIATTQEPAIAPEVTPVLTIVPEPTPGKSSDVDYGPLAVISPSDGLDTARNEGVVDLDGPCAALRARGRVILLLWAADRVTWNATSHSVAFRNPDGHLVTIASGTQVVLGGGGGLLEEDGLTAEAWLAGMSWIARPVASCRFDGYWGVGSIDLG